MEVFRRGVHHLAMCRCHGKGNLHDEAIGWMVTINWVGQVVPTNDSYFLKRVNGLYVRAMPGQDYVHLRTTDE